MPRGRAGLLLIAPERVRAAFKRHYSWHADSPTYIADRWFVSERTVRRWQKTGLPTCYGKMWITPQQWEQFEHSGIVPSSSSSGFPSWAIPPIATPAKNEKVSGTTPRSSRTGVDRVDQKPVRPIARTGAAVKWWPMRGRARG